MKKSNIYLLGMILLWLLIGLFYVLSTISHERIHQAIYRHYGIQSEVHYSFLSFTGVSGTTRAIGDVSRCTEACFTSHELNEIVTYNLTDVTMFIAFMFMIYLLIEGMKAVNDENSLDKLMHANFSPKDLNTIKYKDKYE